MAETGKVHLYTLDSHEYFGPFASEVEAHTWGKAAGALSYQLTTRVGWGCEVRKPFKVSA